MLKGFARLIDFQLGVEKEGEGKKIQVKLLKLFFLFENVRVLSCKCMKVQIS